MHFICRFSMYLQSTYKIPRLKKDAFPTKFLSEDENKLHASEVTTSDRNLDCCNKGENGRPFTQSELDTDDSNFTFKDLVATKKLRLPLNWSQFVSIKDDNCSRVCYSKREMKVIDNVERLIELVGVIIFPDLHFQINVMGKNLVDLKSIGINVNHIIDIEFLEDILELLSYYNICIGYETNENLDTTVAFRDVSNAYRHNNCELLLSNRRICSKCECIIRNDKLKKKRLEENQGNYKRIRISGNLSAQDANKLKMVNSKMKSAVKKNIVLFKEMEDLRSQLAEAHQKIYQSDGQKIENIMLKLKMDEQQKEVVRTIIAAAKNKNSKQNRYSENWLILSILLHMRSPKSFRFIRENKILPLPCVATIRR